MQEFHLNEIDKMFWTWDERIVWPYRSVPEVSLRQQRQLEVFKQGMSGRRNSVFCCPSVGMSIRFIHYKPNCIIWIRKKQQNITVYQMTTILEHEIVYRRAPKPIRKQKEPTHVRAIYIYSSIDRVAQQVQITMHSYRFHKRSICSKRCEHAIIL